MKIKELLAPCFAAAAIEIDSTPGRGTAVRLIIPRVPSALPAAAGSGGGA